MSIIKPVRRVIALIPIEVMGGGGGGGLFKATEFNTETELTTDHSGSGYAERVQHQHPWMNTN